MSKSVILILMSTLPIKKRDLKEFIITSDIGGMTFNSFL